jgi:hypothetical protein
MELSDVVFEITESGKSARDFQFRDQIRAAAAVRLDIDRGRVHSLSSR